MTNKTKTPATKTVVPTVGSNSNKLPWPQDLSGSTAELRRGAVRAVGRIGGSEANLARVLKTLEVAADYARVRCEEQRVEQQKRYDFNTQRNETIVQNQIANTKRLVATKQKEASRVQRELEALEAKVK